MPKTSSQKAEATRIPNDYIDIINAHNRTWAPYGGEPEVLERVEFNDPERLVRIDPRDVDDEFVTELIRLKGIPTFRFLDGRVVERNGIVELVPELPDAEFDNFITGLVNVDSLFWFLDSSVPVSSEGKELFEWSIGISKDPSWSRGFRRITNTFREEVIGAYCNLWAERAKEKGCSFPVRDAISIALRPKIYFHVK